MIQPTKEERKLEQSQEPPKYTVVILDDPYTSIEFVIELLQVVFKLSHEDSELIAYNIHSAGKQNVGEFSKEIAETKSVQCNQVARANEFPLLTEIEKL